MNVSLTPELEKFVQEKLQSGRYSSALEVIQEALRLLEERDRIDKGRLEELKQKIAEGLEASERGEVFDGETVFAELREKNRQRRIQSGQ